MFRVWCGFCCFSIIFVDGKRLFFRLLGCFLGWVVWVSKKDISWWGQMKLNSRYSGSLWDLQILESAANYHIFELQGVCASAFYFNQNTKLDSPAMDTCLTQPSCSDRCVCTVICISIRIGICLCNCGPVVQTQFVVTEIAGIQRVSVWPGGRKEEGKNGKGFEVHSCDVVEGG